MHQPIRDDQGRIALVLAGGAALGAYEVGVLRYLLEEAGGDARIICGTSAGALNACFLAAHADLGAARGRHLADLWTSMRLGTILRPSGVDILAMLFDSRWAGNPNRVRGGVLDRRPLELLFRRAAAMHRIDEQLRAGRLDALNVSATHVASGRCVCFEQARDPLPLRPTNPLITTVRTQLRAEHALASAAIPLLFPPVVVDGEAYCDGGLRQVVPLAPALHLGADALLVIDPVAVSSLDPPARAARVETLASPLYLAGKALNALLQDRMEVDLARLDQLNAIIAAGLDRFGPDFADELNREMVRRGRAPIRPIAALSIRPSRDIGQLAAEYIGSPEFARREPGLVGRLLRLMARGAPERTGDLLSYLLFDGAFASRLVELGWADAHARHAELVAFFAGAGADRRAS